MGDPRRRDLKASAFCTLFLPTELAPDFMRDPLELFPEAEVRFTTKQQRRDGAVNVDWCLHVGGGDMELCFIAPVPRRRDCWGVSIWADDQPETVRLGELLIARLIERGAWKSPGEPGAGFDYYPGRPAGKRKSTPQ